jgi:hypothetical protein
MNNRDIEDIGEYYNKKKEEYKGERRMNIEDEINL